MFVQVFADLFNPVIKERHNGYDPCTMKHPTDLDSSKVCGNVSVIYNINSSMVILEILALLCPKGCCCCCCF